MNLTTYFYEKTFIVIYNLNYELYLGTELIINVEDLILVFKVCKRNFSYLYY